MIACFKLTTGEEVISEYSENMSGEYVLDTPISIMMVPSQQGQFGIGLVPFMPYANGGKIVIQKQNVITVVEPNGELRNQYHNITGKGLIVATTPDLKTGLKLL